MEKRRLSGQLMEAYRENKAEKRVGSHRPNLSPARVDVVPITPSVEASITIIVPGTGTVTFAAIPSPIIIFLPFPTTVSVVSVPCTLALPISIVSVPITVLPIPVAVG